MHVIYLIRESASDSDCDVQKVQVIVILCLVMLNTY